MRPDLAAQLDELLPEIGEVAPLEHTAVDDLVRVARALATGSQGRGLGPDVCARLYAELRGIVGILSADGGMGQDGGPTPSAERSRSANARRLRSSSNGFLAP